MKRIVWHWTGGTYTPTDYERRHYHFLIDGLGLVVEGDRPPEVNRAPLGPHYVRHAGGFNSDAIGLAFCAMGGAQERPLDPGAYPTRQVQLDAMVRLSADLCETYRIRPGRDTTLLHSEIRPRFGRGVYKWDVNLLPGYAKLLPPTEAGDAMRELLVNELAARRANDAPRIARARRIPVWVPAWLRDIMLREV